MTFQVGVISFLLTLAIIYDGCKIMQNLPCSSCQNETTGKKTCWVNRYSIVVTGSIQEQVVVPLAVPSCTHHSSIKLGTKVIWHNLLYILRSSRAFQMVSSFHAPLQPRLTYFKRGLILEWEAYLIVSKMHYQYQQRGTRVMLTCFLSWTRTMAV